MERIYEILSILAMLLLIAQRMLALWRDYKRLRKERSKKKRG